jgi:hypothetical protein
MHNVGAANCLYEAGDHQSQLYTMDKHIYMNIENIDSLRYVGFPNETDESKIKG